MAHLTATLALALLAQGQVFNVFPPPYGDDATGDGSSEKPFATPAVALEAVRRHRLLEREEGREPVEVVVHLWLGTNRLEESLVLDEELSGVPGAPTVIRGTFFYGPLGGSSPLGVYASSLAGSGRIPSEALAPLVSEEVAARLPSDAARAAVRVVDLAALGIDDPGEVQHRGMGVPTVPPAGEVTWDGRVLTPARWPNRGFASYEEVIDPGTRPRDREPDVAEEDRETDPPRGGAFRFDDERLERWASAEGMWMLGYWHFDWAEELLPVAEVDPDAGTVRLGLPHRYGLRAGGRFYVTGLLEELDSPGEYTIDRKAKKLYLWPPRGSSDAELSITTLAEPLIHLKGCRYVVIDYLQLSDTRGEAIRIEGGEGCTVHSCHISRTGTTGISVSGAGHAVRDCELSDIGGTGIALSGGDRRTLEAGGHQVIGCEITRFGRIHRTYHPGISISGVGHLVRGNLLHDAPHGAILFSGNDHLIERNEIHDVLLETGDCGAIYTGRDWTTHGNLIRHNFIHDLPGSEDRWQNAIYLDDMASGIRVEGNILYRCNLGMLIGGGRHLEIRGNAFVDCSLGLRFDSRGVGWMAEHIEDPETSTLHRRLRAVPIGEPPWSTRFPELQATLTDDFGMPVGSRVVGNVFFGTPFGHVADPETVEVGGNPELDRGPGFFEVFLDPPSPWAGPPHRELTVPDVPTFRPIPIAAFGLRKEAGQARIPSPSPLLLEAPIERWDEALPIGNGATGGLLWGEGRRIRLSLDRGDLWDLRRPEVVESEEWCYETMKRLKAEGEQARMQELFDHPYNRIPYPTKLPGARLELELGPGREAREFKLDLARAEASVDPGVRAFFSATEPVAMLRVEGPEPEIALIGNTAVERLGYEPPRIESSAGEWTLVQEAALGLEYAVVVRSRREGYWTTFAIAFCSNGQGGDPLDRGRAIVQEALDRGYEALLDEHLAWWRDFWSTSDVRLPETAIQAHYDLVKSFYGAASRPGSPPIPLQGVWTADEGNLPPWKGDYHHDLNTQMTYLAYHAAGLMEQGRSFLDFNWDLLPRYREFARGFYGVGGAVIPGVSALDGRPLGGWGMYSLSPTNGAWVAQSFHLHWRYTRDREFLAERAYPFCAEIAEALVELCEPDESGMLKLPLSSSPEIFDNRLEAFLEPNSNYDLALLRWLLAALEEMALELPDEEAAARWRGLLERLDPLDVDPDLGTLTFCKGQPYHVSHRHFSHTMAIHPLGLLSVEGTDEEREVVRRTLAQIEEKGTSLWTGYSFSWMACMLARAGQAEKALDHLRKYERAFISRNGFHLNGDQTGEGLSNFRYRPFTLEGNFLAMEAVHEMLLQSWGGVVRVFPAVSAEWRDVSFRDLRAEGGFRVSAERSGALTRWVDVRASAPATLRLRDPFAGADVEWSLPVHRLEGGLLEVEMKAGQVLRGSRR